MAWVESRDEPWAYNYESGSAGEYQFMPETWTAITGLAPPASAYPLSVQTQAAEELLAQQGTTPWAGDGC